MKHLLLSLTALLFLAGTAMAQGELLPSDPAPSQDLPVDEGGSDSIWNDGLVVGLGLRHKRSERDALLA